MVLFDECDDLNCNPTCQTGLLPGTREETESIVVKAVVLATFLIAVLTLAAGESVLLRPTLVLAAVFRWREEAPCLMFEVKWSAASQVP